MDQNPSLDVTEIEEPANLRFLRRLVTILTATMILGLLAIFTILVMRFSADPVVPLPEEITLPEGKTAASFTQGGDWFAIMTTDDEILIFDRTTRDLRQRLQIQ